MMQAVTQSASISWATVLSPVMTAFLTLVTVWIGVAAKNRLEKTTTQTKDQLNSIAVVADKTHILVNSQMGQQLMMYAITARTLADLTHKKEHIEAAEEADKKLADHVWKQKLVDAGEADKK